MKDSERAIAYEFEKDGSQVALLARQDEDLEAAKDMKSDDDKIIILSTDVADTDAVESAAHHRNASSKRLMCVDVFTLEGNEARKNSNE